jgi:predicted transcriptional regulator
MTAPTATITIRIPSEMREELEALAKSTGRNRSSLVEEARRRFIDVQRWQIARIEEGVRAADAGDFVTDEEMNEVWTEFGLDSEQDRVAG